MAFGRIKRHMVQQEEAIRILRSKFSTGQRGSSDYGRTYVHVVGTSTKFSRSTAVDLNVHVGAGFGFYILYYCLRKILRLFCSRSASIRFCRDSTPCGTLFCEIKQNVVYCPKQSSSYKSMAVQKT